jgi:DNA helicase IV
MANDVSASFVTHWAKEQQTVFYKTNVAMKIADTTFRDQMSYGKILTRTYRSSNAVQAYVPGTDITEDAKTDTAETNPNK